MSTKGTTDATPRVLHISTESGFRGGEQQVANLMRGLAARGIAQGLASPLGTPLAQARPDAIPQFAIPARRGNPLEDIVALRRAVVEFQPTILHAHTSHGHSLARVAQTLGLVRLPLLVTRRVDFPLKPSLGNHWKYLSSSVRYIAISTAVKQALEQGGVPAERIRLVRSGVDPERFGGFRSGPPQWGETILGSLGLNESRGPLWICVAALTDHKDHGTLLRAAARLRQQGLMFQLAIAGDGELRENLESLAAELQVTSQVRFLGRVEGPALAALHRAATGFVLTSHLEGLGTAVIDAMAAGLPVVATAAGGIPELVEDGRTGWLCPVRDDAAVARAMCQVMAGTVEGADVAGRVAAARAHVLHGFTLDAMVDGTVQSYLSP